MSPRKPKKPCRYPGCKELTDERYCTEHKQLMDKQYRQNERDLEAEKFYQSKEWRNLRRVKLNINPLCEECFRHNRYAMAEVVDHIIPIKYGGARLDITNLQSLCKSCHSSKSAREGSRWG